MRTVILNSGSVHKYAAIGKDGVLVWRSAEAFLNALRNEKQLGADVVKFLAIPKASQGGDHIDWYIPFESQKDDEYEIVRWSSASIEEKRSALRKLDLMSKKLEIFGLDLEALALSSNDKLFAHFINGNGGSDNLPALHFPDTDCLFIVDNQPVITFWGFTKLSQVPRGAPFDSLHAEVDHKPLNKKVSSANHSLGTGATATAATMPFWKRHFWCLLWPLLLLFLLLLAYLLWRFLFPFGGTLGSVTIPPYAESPKDAYVETLKDPILNKNNADIGLKKDDTKFNLTDRGDNITINKDEGLVHIYDNDASLYDTQVLDADGNVIAKEGAVLDPDLDSVDEDVVLDPKDNATTQDDPAVLNDDVNKDKGVDDHISDNQKQDQTAIDNQKNTESNAQDLNKQVDPFLNTKPLELFDGDISKGNIQVLDGNWKVKSPIVEANTGKSVDLQYTFDKDGNGKAVIKQQNGTKCEASVKGSMVSGELQINNESTAVCSDKTVFNMPKIKCKAGINGNSDCSAVYGDGQDPESKFNIELRK